MRYETARKVRPGRHFLRDVVQPFDGLDADGFVPAGTIIDHPDAWKKVRIGDAYPADEECRIRANMSDREIQRRIDHQTRSLQKLADHLNELADEAEESITEETEPDDDSA